MKEKILIVEDDFIALEGLKLDLESEGYVTFLANCGKQALDILKKVDIDLILSDIIMNDISGIDLLQRVKNKYPDIVVILITGYGALDTVIEALRQGAHDYLLKPCSGEELKICVKRGLEKRQLSQIIKEKSRQDTMLDLIAGFAKTLNDLVASISGSYEILRTYLNNNSNSYVKKSVEHTGTFIKKSARIVDDLCVTANLFSEAPISAFNLHEAFRDIKIRFGYDFIVFNIPERLPLVNGGSRLAAAFQNIIQNGIDASPGNPYIKITCYIEAKADAVALVFEDQGCGISEDNLTKVFLPFFTTKSKTNAGLGLWIAYQTIAHYKGNITIYSEKFVGTMVKVRLPIYRA
ncbi:response regulator [candidate division KSB1 bacterium]|nr:response regulator [candidate division KSB1 bacterium]